MREEHGTFGSGAAPGRGGRAAAAERELTAEALLSMSRSEIEETYRAGAIPDSLEALEGSARGYVPVVIGLHREPVASLIRRLAHADGFPWLGKRFESAGPDRAEGANELRVVGDFALFSSSIEPSALDGAPCVRIDYDRPENPLPIRRIRDEIREVAPGLFLGPAMIEAFGRSVPVLYFALDFGE